MLKVLFILVKFGFIQMVEIYAVSSRLDNLLALEIQNNIELRLYVERKRPCSCLSRIYTKIETIQGRSAWLLLEDDMQNREAFHIF